MRLRLLWLLLLAGACVRPATWFRADQAPSRDDAYDERFALIAADAGCEPIADLTRPIIVLVPGVGGDGDEMHAAVPVLMASKPAAMFMLRYSPFDNFGALADRLAAEISRLAACSPQGHFIVLSHSAGGVLSSFAVSQVVPPPGVEGIWLTLLTAASPLAGTSGLQLSTPARELRLMRVLGTRNTQYPAPAAGVRVVHLRSSAKSDGFMRPSGAHIPNDPTIGSPGAPQIDLPEELDHPNALIYVAKRIADGTWTQWLTASPSP